MQVARAVRKIAARRARASDRTEGSTGQLAPSRNTLRVWNSIGTQMELFEPIFSNLARNLGLETQHHQH